MKKYNSILLIFYFLFSGNLGFSQIGLLEFSGTQSNAMGDVSSSLTGAAAIFNNHSHLSKLTDLTFIASTERRFELAEIKSIGIGMALPWHNIGTIGLSMNSFGLDDYKEIKITIFYARKLLENLSLSAAFDFINTRIIEFGTKNLGTFEIGISSKLSDQFTLSSHVYSPIRVSTINQEGIPGRINVGLAYKPSAIAEFHAEFSKQIDFQNSIRVGLEYQLMDEMKIRFGYNTNPAKITTGLAYALKEWIIADLGVSYHQVLGITPSLGIVYINKKNGEE